MDAKIQQITIVVKDQAASLDFYTKKAGFEIKSDYSLPGGNRWVTVGLPGQELEFALFALGSPVNPEQAKWAKDWAPARAPPVVLRVADCKAVYAELSGRGVPFLQPPKEYPWGTAATFADPDGNLWSLNQPPAWGGKS